MKKTIVVVILFSAISANAFSQVDSTKVAFVSYWFLGDSYDFKISKIQQRWKEGELTTDKKQEYIANFTVIDSTESSYTIKWSFENDIENSYGIPTELVDKFSKYKLTEIEYKTSEVGDFLEVLNWKEVGDIMNNMFDDIIEVSAKKDEKTRDALKKVMQPFRLAYGSQQGIEQLVLKELQYFHFPMGLEYDITEPLIYDEELPNMLGGDPIKAKGKIYFENVDFEEGFCVMTQEMNLDPNDTKDVLNQVFKKMKLKDKELSKALKTSVLEINDKNIYEYYYDPGVPHKIETTRESIMNIAGQGGKRVDKVIIELIYNE